jgi:Domain of unknown function (DUF4868)
LEDLITIEFGICSLINQEHIINLIPIDQSVRDSLLMMHVEFYNAYFKIADDPRLFEPSEKYAQTEKLFIPLTSYDSLAEFDNLHKRSNIPVSDINLNEIASSIVYYFAVFHYKGGRKQIGIKRPSQFKGLLSKKSHLIRFVDDTLQIIPDEVFKLDNDFDFIINADEIDILHPTGFIFLADIEEAILSSAATSTQQLAHRIAFINFESISSFVGTSKTAAKLIASIRSRDDLELTDMQKVINKCADLGVLIIAENNLIGPEEKHIIQFLQILDRRQYDVDLTERNPEIYVASSRTKVN